MNQNTDNKLSKSQVKEDIKIIKNSRKTFIKNLKNEKNIYFDSISDKKVKKKQKQAFEDVLKKGISYNEKPFIIELKNVNKFFYTSANYEHILKNINLSIVEGSVVVILGASGSGKTTLLNIMSGLLTPESGHVVINDKDLFFLKKSSLVKFRSDYISFVFQSYNLISSLNVVENIKVSENLRPKNAEKIKIKSILETLDLADHSKKYPYQLSGGQQQRISIGRALAKNPKILFADEPTGALDEDKGRDSLKLLLNINKKFKTTLIIVTHNPNIAHLADQVIKIKDGRVFENYYNNQKININDLK